MRTIRYGVARYFQKLVRSSKSWAGAAVAAELFKANPVVIIQTDSIQPTAMPDPSATSLDLRSYFSGEARASFLNRDYRRHALQTIPPNHGPRRAARALHADSEERQCG